jgi:hypothetical protein
VQCLLQSHRFAVAAGELGLHHQQIKVSCTYLMKQRIFCQLLIS